MDMHQEPGIRHLTYDQLVASTADHECPGIGRDHICVRIAAVADLPTMFGTFHIVGFWNDRDGKDHVAIVKGDPFDKEDVPVRMHSECLTGDALGSLRCDCRDQLTSSLRAIGEQETGMVLYLRQEGRGIGLLNKLRAYGLQDEGLDTVDANLALGFRDDERDYSIAAHMLGLLQVRSIKLMTNNPKKVQGLRDLGIDVSGRIPSCHPGQRAQPLLPGDQGAALGASHRCRRTRAPARADRPTHRGGHGPRHHRSHRIPRPGGGTSMSERPVALITGATGGLGHVLAPTSLPTAMTSRCSARTPSDSRARELGLDLPDDHVFRVGVNLRDAAAAASAIEAVYQRFGRVDALAHLVGGWTGGMQVAGSPDDPYASMIDQHLWTTLNVTRELAPRMAAAGHGRIVAVSSPMAE